MEEDDILNEEVSMDDAEVSFIEDSEEGFGTDEPVGSIVQYVQERFWLIMPFQILRILQLLVSQLLLLQH